MCNYPRSDPLAHGDNLQILINIRICSGLAFFSASRLEGLAGQSLAYTTNGTPTNLAAGLCGLAGVGLSS